MFITTWLTTIWDFGTAVQYPMLRNVGVQEVEPPGALPLCTNDLIGTYTETIDDGVEQAMDVDKDGDGLIEICDLEGLNEMRFVLDGSGYTTGTSAMGAMKITTGCPNDRCTGYELTRDLDFMDDDSYRPESTNRMRWTTNPTWDPIGTDAANERFNATFNGNSYTISNLGINRSGTSNVGLFGATGGSAGIANLGLLNVIIVGQNNLGSLVGRNAGGSIANSYATGSVAEAGNNVGGLVGRNVSGSITNSYAAISVSRSGFNAGGLVGLMEAGSITNSYATGRVSGFNTLGGLVGRNNSGSITNSYATGRVSWSSPIAIAIGGLVGFNAEGGTIDDSYWLRDSANANRTGNSVPRDTLQTMMAAARADHSDWHLRQLAYG